MLVGRGVVLTADFKFVVPSRSFALQERNRQEFYNNADAGADMAMQMLRLLQQLGRMPSFADISMIVKVRKHGAGSRGDGSRSLSFGH